MKTDVLFINPGNTKKSYQDLLKQYTAIATPVWTSLIAGFTRNKGVATAIHDINVEGWDVKEVLGRYNPELIVMMAYGHHPSASTQTMPVTSQIANSLKEQNKDIPVALGGTHPSALPERTLREESVDYIMQGEGPYTVIGLIDCIKGKGSLESVKGLWYEKNGEIIGNQVADVVTDLDNELGDYAWDMLPDLTNYRAHNMHCFGYFEKSEDPDFVDVRTPYVSMNTSLGCPYGCHFCCINAIFGKPSIRYWSLEKVMTWLDELYNKYKVRHIRFDDELFILSPSRVERFCDLLIERGYDLNIWVYGRVDTINERLLKKLKKAGVNWICLGIESASEKVRKDVNKKINKDIKHIVNKIQEAGIYVLGNYMFGLPEDDMSTMEETLKMAMDLNCEYANFYTVMAYPGSMLYETAVKDGLPLPDKWSGFSQLGYDTRPLPTNYLSPQEVLRFRDEAFNKYHENIAYLDMMESKFGKKVRIHIENMLKSKLKRAILE